MTTMIFQFFQWMLLLFEGYSRRTKLASTFYLFPSEKGKEKGGKMYFQFIKFAAMHKMSIVLFRRPDDDDRHMQDRFTQRGEHFMSCVTIPRTSNLFLF